VLIDNARQSAWAAGGLHRALHRALLEGGQEIRNTVLLLSIYNFLRGRRYVLACPACPGQSESRPLCVSLEREFGVYVDVREVVMVRWIYGRGLRGSCKTAPCSVYLYVIMFVYICVRGCVHVYAHVPMCRKNKRLARVGD
jgi:hypothetical protein